MNLPICTCGSADLILRVYPEIRRLIFFNVVTKETSKLLVDCTGFILQHFLDGSNEKVDYVQRLDAAKIKWNHPISLRINTKYKNPELYLRNRVFSLTYNTCGNVVRDDLKDTKVYTVEDGFEQYISIIETIRETLKHAVHECNKNHPTVSKDTSELIEMATYILERHNPQ